ncbi:MAG: hypothetical protein DWQ05_03880 [Calditrichaeota bacterium]|nr:MAG: hypothetical protein DWQ05_03880 [Calditrichota bacterium]
MNKLHLTIFSFLCLVTHSGFAQEGLTIQTIDFKGNKAFSESELLVLMELSEKKNIISRFFSGSSESSRYSEYVLQRDLKRIINFYKTEGYPHAKIDSFHIDFKEDEGSEDYSGTLDIDIFISEGLPVFINNLSIISQHPDSSQIDRITKILQPLRKRGGQLSGKRFQDQGVVALKSQIIFAFNNSGYPFANLKLNPILIPEENKVNVEFILNPGKRIFLDSIEVTGNKKIPTSLIQKQLTIKPGQQYQIKRIQKSRQQIYNLGVFSIVTIKILTEKMKENRVPVQIIVKEAPRLTTKIGTGWGRDDRFRGYVEVSRLGFLGGARKQTLFVKHSYREPVTLNWEMIQPAALGPKNNLSLKPFYRRQREESFKAERTGQTTSLFRIMGNHTRGTLAYTLERVRTQYQDFDARYTKSSVTMHIYRDSSKPLFVPSRGMYSSVIYTFSGLGFNSRTFGKIQLEAKRYKKIYQQLILAYKAKAGHGYVFGSNPVFPQEELFYAGGSTSVRGWYRSRLGPYFPGTTKPSGGVNLFEGSTELRFPVWREFGSVVFLDFGNVWNGKYGDIFNKDKDVKIHFAAGMGIRYLTPIGPIRLDIGREVFNSSGNNREIAFHISIGQAF